MSLIKIWNQWSHIQSR